MTSGIRDAMKTTPNGCFTDGDWKRDYGSRSEARSESDGIASGP